MTWGDLLEGLATDMSAELNTIKDHQEINKVPQMGKVSRSAFFRYTRLVKIQKDMVTAMNNGDDPLIWKLTYTPPKVDENLI